ncbi:acylglycerol kinase family protein [Candidatus Saccharibacteria bacterium]|nr:acylglycerol kinase family protein [Candidatus Saccharibacteria bacterium]
MRRLLIVYNPRSSRFVDVEKEVLSKARELKGFIIGKYEVEPTDVDKNAAKFAKLLKDGDLVLSAGGDATGIIASNGILKSGKDATLAVLPYGNFNDLARTLGTMSTDKLFKIIETWTGDTHKGDPGTCGFGGKCVAGPVQRLYPLEIYVDGKFFRYASCYMTIGMTAEVCEIFDEPKFRKKMQKGSKSSWRSYLALSKWYFKNRHKKVFIPPFTINGKPAEKKASDYCALSGKSMCRVMKGGDDYLKPKIFRSMNRKLTSFPRLFVLMVKAIFVRTPGEETTGDKLEFLKPATVELQAEGEYRVFKNIKTIEIKKGDKCLKVIHG